MKNRSVIELMVLTFTGLVTFMMVVGWSVLAVVEIRDPDTDTQTLTQSLMTLTAGILGALLGLLAGKTATATDLGTRPNGTPDTIEEF